MLARNALAVSTHSSVSSSFLPSHIGKNVMERKKEKLMLCLALEKS